VKLVRRLDAVVERNLPQLPTIGIIITLTLVVIYAPPAMMQAHTHHGWWRGVVVSGVRRMNEGNPHQARLVLG